MIAGRIIYFSIETGILFNAYEMFSLKTIHLWDISVYFLCILLFPDF